jgi:predicted RNA binding protein YcfA (HicA-like mRNA interferase family)
MQNPMFSHGFSTYSKFLFRRGKRPIYGHPDGRLTSIHYHTGSDTLTRKTLRSVLQATRWTEADLRRLRLLP